MFEFEFEFINLKCNRTKHISTTNYKDIFMYIWTFRKTQTHSSAYIYYTKDHMIPHHKQSHRWTSYLLSTNVQTIVDISKTILFSSKGINLHIALPLASNEIS